MPVKDCQKELSNLQFLIGFLSENPSIAFLIVAGIIVILFFAIFVIYKRGLTIGNKIIIPSQEERNEYTKFLEESKFYQKPDFIQKVAGDYCWFYSNKGAAVKFGGSTWNHDDHYQELDLFQTLLLNDSVDSIEFINSSIPSRVLTSLEKKLSKFQEEGRKFTIYASPEQKRYLESNLSLYENKVIIEI
jgi:hypothetical protein